VTVRQFFRKLPAAIAAAGIFYVPIARAETLSVTIHNDLPFARRAETIELTAASLSALGSDLTKIRVFEQGSANEVLAQALDLDADGAFESLIFQADFPARGTRTFDLKLGERRTYRREDFRVYGRFNRERFDDFAWENDRVAHRMYGPSLETWQKEPLTSSTVDVWLKRTRRLVINDWYMADDYHRDNGEGADFYSAGRSRGCGGSGLWRDGRLVVSKNFRESRVLANGPIRLVFELHYPSWNDAPGIRAETKRITLDAGQNFNRLESRYDMDGELRYAAGIKKLPVAQFRIERGAGWLRSWEPVKGGAGEFGCAVVFDPKTIVDVAEAEGNQLVIARGPAVYHVGSAWNRSGDFVDAADFDRVIEEWALRIGSPLRIEVKSQ
jgi:unsaturated rhamnogalacturonyl hydrolase